MGKEEAVDRRRGVKPILHSGQGWTLSAQLRQLKTGQDGKGCCEVIFGAPNDLARLRDRLD